MVTVVYFISVCLLVNCFDIFFYSKNCIYSPCDSDGDGVFISLRAHCIVSIIKTDFLIHFILMLVIYSFLVSRNGTIYEGRGWLWKPEKSNEFPNFDGKYIEISYIGNCNGRIELRSFKRRHLFIANVTYVYIF